MSLRKAAVLALLVLAGVAFFALDLPRHLDLTTLKVQQAALQDWVSQRPWSAAGLYFLLYVGVTSLSLPGAALMTLVAGALFGLLLGTLLVSFAATLGATLAMLISRYLLRDWVRGRFGQRLATIDQGVEREGAFYLFALRLVPAFPFFLINLAMGLTRMPVRTFWWVSQLGMLPGTLVYVNAGEKLAEIEALGDILSPGLIGAFVLLGLLPLLSRKALDLYKARRARARWQKPRRFDRNLIVIGAGSGGLVAANLAAALKAKVTLIERERMGGDCLNTGCVPSKALIRSARLAHELRHAERLGIRGAQGEVDFPAVMARVRRVIADIAPHDSVDRYEKLGVEVLKGHGHLVTPWTVDVEGRRLTARAIILATGARPVMPVIPGIEQVPVLTSDTVWALTTLPERLLVIGGGPIGCELAQAFQRLGSRVCLVQRNEQLLPREDADAAAQVARSLQADGVDLRLMHEAVRFTTSDGQHQLVCRDAAGTEVAICFDQVLVALGRQANTDGLGLEALGIELTPRGALSTDKRLATRFPHIFAVGDVAGPYQFTHTAAHQAWYATVNALFGDYHRLKVDDRVIPWTTFTDPEVARVGLNEQEARDAGIAYERTCMPMAELDRAVTDEACQGFIKVLTASGSDRILGATIVGEQAGNLIAEYVAAMKHGHGLNKILGTIHVYPTLAEANKAVAAQWKRAHAPAWALRLLERFHRWKRR